MKELDEMEKVNAKLSVAVEEVTLEHCKKNEVKLSWMNVNIICYIVIGYLNHWKIVRPQCRLCFSFFLQVSFDLMK